LVEQTGVSEENQRPVASHWQIYHISYIRFLLNAIFGANFNYTCLNKTLNYIGYNIAYIKGVSVDAIVWLLDLQLPI
jgi:hypothetical protein